MANTIFWGVLLWKKSQKKLLEVYKPQHPNIYAEHMTIVFNPTEEQNKAFMEQIGMPKTLTVTGIKCDDKCDAVVVTGERRLNGGIPHITISCADGVKPFYSNKLLDGGWDFIEPIVLFGNLARYTKNGWLLK